MAAYIVMTRLRTHDPAGLSAYAEAAQKAPSTSARVVASTKTGRWQSLEGDAPDVVSVIRFNDWDEAMGWYASPEYQAARQHRLPACDVSAVIVEADEPGT